MFANVAEKNSLSLNCLGHRNRGPGMQVANVESKVTRQGAVVEYAADFAKRRTAIENQLAEAEGAELVQNLLSRALQLTAAAENLLRDLLSFRDSFLRRVALSPASNSTKIDELKRNVEEMKERAASASDPELRKELNQSADFLDTQVQSLEKMQSVLAPALDRLGLVAVNTSADTFALALVDGIIRQKPWEMVRRLTRLRLKLYSQRPALEA